MCEFNGSFNITQEFRAFDGEEQADHNLNNAMNNGDIFCDTFAWDAKTLTPSEHMYIFHSLKM